MDGLKEKERRGSGDSVTFWQGQSYSLDDGDGAGFALMDLLSMRCHVSLLHGHITPRPLIKSWSLSRAICLPDASHLSTSLSHSLSPSLCSSLGHSLFPLWPPLCTDSVSQLAIIRNNNQTPRQ